MISLVFIIGLLALVASPAFTAPLSAPPKKTLIDLHAHVAGTGAGGSGCYISPRLRRNWRYSSYLKAFGLTPLELEKEGDALVFRRLSNRIEESQSVLAAVVLALDGVVDENGDLDLPRTEMYIPNEFIARETARYPNLLFGASVNPYRRDALERLEEAAREGAVLVKWLPAIQQIDPADPRLVPFYLRMKELDLPLLVHTGDERAFTRARHDVGDPEKLRLPLSLGVTVIAAHAASTGETEGQENTDRLLAMMPEYPHLYGDISSLTQLNKLGYLQRLLKRPECRGRLVYGTDYPLINTPLVSPWFFPLNLTFRQMADLARISNPWDRDVQLKQALGVPREVFTAGNRLIGKMAAPCTPDDQAMIIHCRSASGNPVCP